MIRFCNFFSLLVSGIRFQVRLQSQAPLACPLSSPPACSVNVYLQKDFLKNLKKLNSDHLLVSINYINQRNSTSSVIINDRSDQRWKPVRFCFTMSIEIYKNLKEELKKYDARNEEDLSTGFSCSNAPSTDQPFASRVTKEFY